MWGILVSAFNVILGWVFRTVIIKFVIFSALFLLVTELMTAILTKLDLSPVSGLQAALGGIPSGVLFFLGLFRFDFGLPLLLGAMLTRFIIRRLPIVG
jgi:hypothetical protein